MYRKNVAGQNLPFGLLSITTGDKLTGATVSGYRTIDNGTQVAVTGTITEKGNGQYNLAMSQADTNGNNIGFAFLATGGIPAYITIVTTAADPTDASKFGLALATTNEVGGIVAAFNG